MSEPFIAEVGEVTDTGLTLILAGEATPTEKKYKCNTSAIFKAGDRVLVHEVADTYVVDYVIGEPGRNETPGLLPAGGLSGQVLTKDGSADYAAKWETAHGIPSGGSSGQYLKKSSSTNYAVEWSSEPTPEALQYSTAKVTLNSSSLYPSGSANVTLGSASKPFSGLYVDGTIKIGTSAYGTKIGFFGKTPIAQPTVASTATLETVITQLKNLGLFK